MYYNAKLCERGEVSRRCWLADWCPGRDLNPHSACAKKDFKSFASADFATRAETLPS